MSAQQFSESEIASIREAVRQAINEMTGQIVNADTCAKMAELVAGKCGFAVVVVPESWARGTVPINPLIAAGPRP